MSINLPGKRILREMKYISDQKGIMKRYLAEGDNWDEHLSRSRGFIKKCLEEVKPESVLVLGSGWLLDVPLEFMAEKCLKIFLTDIVHPSQVRHRTAALKNVELITADISGAINATRDFVKKHGRQRDLPDLREISITASLPVQPDFVISLNLLNQIDILLADYLKKFFRHTEEDLLPFRQALQSRHLELLLPGHSCLITDCQERIFNKHNKSGILKNLIHTILPEGSYREEWTWSFDMRGAYHHGYSTDFKVVAIKL